MTDCLHAVSAPSSPVCLRLHQRPAVPRPHCFPSVQAGLPEISKLVSAEWKALSVEDRAPYDTQAQVG